MRDGFQSAQRVAAWPEAAWAIAHWLGDRERSDAVLEGLSPTLVGVERARCQHLVYGVIRHHGRLESALRPLVAHPPRPIVQGVLRVAGFELIEALGNAAEDVEGTVAKIVHHAVERTKSLASASEARLVNAVVRRLGEVLVAQSVPAKLASAETLGAYYSHPAWLVRRWLAQFGGDATRALLEWNQQPGSAHVRWRVATPPPEFLTPTQWPGFYDLEQGHWAEVEGLLREGQLYLQDPATRLAVAALAPQAGETVLDLCAAPGGKSLQIADAMGSGRLVAVDMPGERQPRLRENLGRVRGVTAIAVAAELGRNVQGRLAGAGLPERFAAVLLDAPCSNTGVMRQRVDVKWRLQEGDFVRHSKQQYGMLRAAAECVAPGGRIVYSTCSIDPEENELVVEAFLKKEGADFTLESKTLSRPWESGHDGAGVFCLRRK